MSDVPQGSASSPGDPDHEIFDMQALLDNGIVWALNRFVLHPRGLAMWMHAVPAGAPHDEQTAAGWGIARADDGVWSFDAATDIAGRDKFDAFMVYMRDRAITDGSVMALDPRELPLTFARVAEVNAARAARWHPGFPNEDSWNLADWSNAMCGEAGEAANVVKKLRRYETLLAGGPDDPSPDELREMLADELADVFCYLDLLATKAGVDLAAAVVSKFNRVSERQNFPERL